MKWFTVCLAALSCLNPLFSQAFPIDEVMEMAKKDKGLRLAWVRQEEDRAEIAQEIRSQEKENTERLKEILIRYGLPSGYDDEAEFDLIPSVWNLVIRSSDLAFQQDFLERVSAAGDLWEDDIATLTDRILLRQGKPQRYGTHFHHVEGQLVAYPIENLDLLDELREDMGEDPFDLEMQLQIHLDRAIQKKSAIAFYKVFFNAIHQFSKNPDDYLYYATFTENGAPQKDEYGSLAFDDPALAAAYAVHTETQLFTEALYNESEKPLSVLFVVRSDDNAVQVLTTPLYIYLVPRTSYQVQPDYASAFRNRILYTQTPPEPVAEFACSDPLEPLILNGAKISIKPGVEFEFDDTSILDEVLPSYFFDYTLENETF